MSSWNGSLPRFFVETEEDPVHPPVAELGERREIGEDPDSHRHHAPDTARILVGEAHHDVADGVVVGDPAAGTARRLPRADDQDSLAPDPEIP